MDHTTILLCVLQNIKHESLYTTDYPRLSLVCKRGNSLLKNKRHWYLWSLRMKSSHLYFEGYLKNECIYKGCMIMTPIVNMMYKRDGSIVNKKFSGCVPLIMTCTCDPDFETADQYSATLSVYVNRDTAWCSCTTAGVCYLRLR